MRSERGPWLTAVLIAVLFATAGGRAAGRAAVSVEFLPDGKCDVSAEGEHVHSAMTYRPVASPESTGEYRCALPPVPEGTPVDLRVVLAPGARPAGGGSPALEWDSQSGRWVGTASLAAAPEVIVVPDYFGSAATRARWQQRGLIAAALLAAGAVAVFARRRPTRRPSARA